VSRHVRASRVEDMQKGTHTVTVITAQERNLP